MKTLKKSFPVTGMTCASCAATVEKTIKGQKGIISAAVNYANASALLEYDGEQINLEKIKNSVHAAGYEIITDETVTAEDIEESNLKGYRKLQLNTTLAVVCSIPLVCIAMFGMNLPYANFIMWALATPITVVFGRQFFIGAWHQARHFNANMDTLVALSSGIAYLFSVFNTLFPGFWMSKGIMPPVYFEASGIVITFILIGKLLEDRAKATTSSAIKKLMGLQPYSVVRMGETGEEDILVQDIKIGDILVVKPGEKIAVDGILTLGSSFVNESMLTGEPVAVEKEEGAKVFAGTINQKGSFQYKAEKIGSETLLAHIIKKVQEAQGSKAPIQKLADKIASIFVPVVLVISLITISVWILAGGENNVIHGILSMITVLVIACPCALGLATPTAIIAGMGKGAEQGILIKDAESLENTRKLNLIVFDKTGTLTEGFPEVVDIAWKENTDSELLSSVLYSMELLSEHPLADAITKFYKELKMKTVEVNSFTSITGSGITAVYARNIYFVGNIKLLRSMNIAIPDSLLEKTKLWTGQANTVIWLANQFSAQAAVAISDKIKLSTPTAIREINEIGLGVYMLTGDNEETAYAIAAESGIKDYKAEVSPVEKADFIKKLQAEGKYVGMVGDGINDGPALAQADVSIAMGAGSDFAMDIAQVTLLTSDLRLLPKSITLSRKTVSTIRQNLFWAFIYNIIAIPLAAGVLYPINGFMLNPMIAGAAMVLSSISVVTNSLRLKSSKL